MEESSQLALTLVSVEALVEAWQDTQEDLKLLLSPTLASELSKAPELRAQYRKVCVTGMWIMKKCFRRCSLYLYAIYLKKDCKIMLK